MGDADLMQMGRRAKADLEGVSRGSGLPPFLLPIFKNVGNISLKRE